MADLSISTAPVPSRGFTTVGGGIQKRGTTGIDNNIRVSTGTTSQIRFPSDTPKYYTIFNIYEYARQNFFNASNAGSLGKIKETIVLPLPLSMNDSHNQNIGQVTAGLGAVAGAEAGLAAGEYGGAGAFGAAAGGIIGAAAEKIVRGFAGPAVAAAAPAASFLSGYAPNEFNVVLYKGPTYKNHSLEFQLSPQNLGESKAIRSIINRFHTFSAPSLAAAGVFWKFPHIFQIGYRPNASYLYKFKPAMLISVGVDFIGGKAGPQFYSAKTDNPPESVFIKLSFIELEYWLQENFEGKEASNDPFDVYNSAQGLTEAALRAGRDLFKGIVDAT